MPENNARVLVILAQGAEEMETTIVVDVLRRAKVDVTLAGLDGVAAVTCSRGLRVLPDAALGSVEGEFDAIVLPGGAEGAERLAASKLVGQLLREHWKKDRLVGAICAAPTALAKHGIAAGSTVTNHPSVSDQLRDHFQLSSDPVVEAGRLITSQGPGTSFDFALCLVRRLCGPEIAASVRQPMMLR